MLAHSMKSVFENNYKRTNCYIKRIISNNLDMTLELIGELQPVHADTIVGHSLDFSFEPSHEITALFVLRKFILKTRMRRHPVGLDVWLLVEPFVYFHTLCVRTAKALARMRWCAGSLEPSLVAYVISTIISWAGTFILSQLL